MVINSNISFVRFNKTMKTTYLKEFIEYSQNGVAYIPLGTIEWHGEHLPIETDFMVAQKICELLSRKIKGYVLPPIYLATDKSGKFKGKNFNGMDRHLMKKLQGSVYYLKPKLFYEMISSLVQNLSEQNYSKIIIVTGHGGSKQIEALEKINKNHRRVIFLNPYGNFKKSYGDHADIGELSLFWALYPEEMNKSLKRRIPRGDDYFVYAGHDPREKASSALGREILKQIMEDLLRRIRRATG